MNIKLLAIIIVIGLIKIAVQASEEKIVEDIAGLSLSESFNRRPLKMLAVGAVPSERDHRGFGPLRENIEMTFLNGNHYRKNATPEVRSNEESTDWRGQLIVADFNHPDQRKEILEHYESVFDFIVPDTNVTYFMNLDASFVADFTRMLKIGGKLVLKDPTNFHLMGSANLIMMPETNEDVYQSVCIKPNKYGTGGVTLGDIINGDFYRPKNPVLQSKIRFRGVFAESEALDIMNPVLEENYRQYVHAWIHYHVPNCSVAFVNPLEGVTRAAFAEPKNEIPFGGPFDSYEYLEITRVK